MDKIKSRSIKLPRSPKIWMLLLLSSVGSPISFSQTEHIPFQQSFTWEPSQDGFPVRYKLYHGPTLGNYDEFVEVGSDNFATVTFERSTNFVVVVAISATGGTNGLESLPSNSVGLVFDEEGRLIASPPGTIELSVKIGN